MGANDKDDLTASNITTISTNSKIVQQSAQTQKSTQDFHVSQTLCGSAMSHVKWDSMHSHMCNDGNEAQGGYHYGSETWQLSLSGYMCGVLPLN